MNTEIYRRMVDALATIRDLEQHGCRVTGAHCTLDTTTISIDSPPSAVLAHWAYTLVPPPRGIPVPVTLRLDLGSGVHVEWRPAPHPVRRQATPTARQNTPWPARRAPGIAPQEARP